MQTGLTEKQLKLRKPAQAFLATLFLMTNRVPIIIAIAIGRTISQFGMIPAMIYATNETAATVIAYGSCVLTWLIWSQSAPADAMIVVSEIGEQWSPQTAPAIHADTQTTPIEVVIGKTLIVIGIRIPKVPHDVPVENERKHPIRKMIAGSIT